MDIIIKTYQLKPRDKIYINGKYHEINYIEQTDKLYHIHFVNLPVLPIGSDVNLQVRRPHDQYEV